MLRVIQVVGLVLLGAVMASTTASAQNVGGVFPPTVNEGHQSVQYRLAFNDESNVSDFGFAQRLHYQRAINDDFMWRVIGQTRRTASSDVDLDFIGAELFWEFSDNEDDYKHGVRFDGRIRDDGRAEQLGFNWIHQWKLDDGWSARAILLTGLQVGENSADGVNIQTRTRLVKKLNSGFTVGFENYSNYGNTGDFGDFDDQSHTIGPVISVPVGNGFSIFGGPLFGISGAAPDVETRLWITNSF